MTKSYEIGKKMWPSELLKNQISEKSFRIFVLKIAMLINFYYDSLQKNNQFQWLLDYLKTENQGPSLRKMEYVFN